MSALQIILLACWLLCFSYFILKSAYFKKRVNTNLALGMFYLKFFAGIVYAKFFAQPHFIDRSDTWRFYKESVSETHYLIHHPIAFFKQLFTHGYDSAGSLFLGYNSYWNDLKSNVMIKAMAVLNLLTDNFYYSHILFFNFFVLIGMVWAIQFFKNLFVTCSEKWLWLACCVPSFVFWSSGVHKDGIIFSLIAGAFYYMHQIQNKRNIQCIIKLGCCIVLIFPLRNYVAFTLLISVLLYYSSQLAAASKKVMFVFHLIGGGLLLLLSAFFPNFNIINTLYQKQLEFLDLQGDSPVVQSAFTPTIQGFFSFLPKAIDLVFLTPHWGDVNKLSTFFAAVETFTFTSLLILFLFFKKNKKIPLLVLSLCCFIAMNYLIIGYTVTFSGSIVRYKSLFMPFVFMYLVTQFDSKKVLSNSY